MRLLEKVDDYESVLSEAYEIRCPACHSTIEFAEKELTRDIINLEIIDSKKYFPCPEITFRRFLSRKFAYPSKVNFYDILSLHCLNCKNLVIVASLNRHDFTYKKGFIGYERLVKWVNPLDTYDYDIINHNRKIYEYDEVLDFKVMCADFELKRSEFSKELYTTYNLNFEELVRDRNPFFYNQKEKFSRLYKFN
ncbi:MAG: hypothetical protein IJ890_00240 [Clostridia bacterium]|nr:hypothetical protein [Clostridia bacterium]